MFGAIVFGSIAALFIGIFWGVFQLAAYGCERRAAVMKVKYDYGPIIGCMIEVNGQWIPLSSFRVID